ncbi:hypothetical protein SAY87_019552 [Trapa incisa]|uniref:Erythronate-4-phosphate dehydrogenase family protein n=1 Tax=Trapa incisa TaxID=236973 RepID=A0AAN7Q2B3_9MYRT|nr:hypothetical protein SAY87_019552 [Trapa incisa]
MDDFQEKDAASSMPIPSIHLEIRLFYIRFVPCAALDALPRCLFLRHRHIGISLEINGTRIPDLNPATLTLKRDRVDRDTREVTYISTDCVRISGSVEFEVLDGEDVVLCGSLERMDDHWTSNRGFENDSRPGWSMDCYAATPISRGIRNPSPSLLLIDVYMAGCCSGSPVVLSKKIKVSPRRKTSKQGVLDSIPEGEDERMTSNGFLPQPLPLPQTSSEIPGSDEDSYESDMKYRHSLYSQDMYTGEDGEISWFNAGVRVGVGISLGVCVGIGLGVGLLMRSYQATTRNFRRRFF